MRVLVGVGAWLLGVGAATGGSLLAVSLLGQGIAASTTQQLTQAAVTRALASEAAEATTGPGQTRTSAPAAAPSPTRSHRSDPPTIPPSQPEASQSASSASARPSPTHSAHATASPRPTPTPTSSPTQASTVLISQGGSVVAECLPGGAYLLSWSPTQGYEVGPVIRGPALNAQARFESSASTVTMVVSCSAGVPTAITTVTNRSGGGVGGHDE